MFCGKCGKQIGDHAKFCPYCGAETGAKIKNMKTEITDKNVKSSKRKIGVVVAGAACICMIAGTALFLWKGNEKTGSPDSNVVEEETVPETSIAEETTIEESTEEDTTAETIEETATEENTELQEEETEESDSGEPERVWKTLDNDYVLPECETRYYTYDELRDIHPDELYIARNEIYARHGRMFKNEKLNEYFSSKSWYTPKYTPEEFDAMGDSVFNNYELANRAVLIELEKVIE